MGSGAGIRSPLTLRFAPPLWLRAPLLSRLSTPSPLSLRRSLRRLFLVALAFAVLEDLAKERERDSELAVNDLTAELLSHEGA